MIMCVGRLRPVYMLYDTLTPFVLLALLPTPPDYTQSQARKPTIACDYRDISEFVCFNYAVFQKGRLIAGGGLSRTTRSTATPSTTP